MAKSLANQGLVSSMLVDDSVLVEVGGSIKRIKLSKFMDAINQGDEMMLSQFAWGVPLKETSNTAWGRVGNLQAWEEYKRMSGRFLVTPDGRAAKLNPNSSSVYADGTPLDESKGHILTICPRMYYRVQEDSKTGTPILWKSHIPIGGNYIGSADNGMANAIGAYKANLQGGVLVSRSGLVPTGNRTISANWASAQAIGKDWGITSYDARKLMLMLLLSEYGDSNAQKVLGGGVGGTTNASLWEDTKDLLTGATSVLGDNSGKIPIDVDGKGVDTCRISLIGIEDFYGWSWEQVMNIYYGSSANSAQVGNEVFIYEGNRMPTTTELETQPNGKFRQLVRPITSGYVSNLILGDDFDWIAKTLGGGSSTHWASYNYNNTTGQLCLAGGSSNVGAGSGLVYAHSTDAFAYADAAGVARLEYHGPLTYVDGKQIA